MDELRAELARLRAAGRNNSKASVAEAALAAWQRDRRDLPADAERGLDAFRAAVNEQDAKHAETRLAVLTARRNQRSPK